MHLRVYESSVQLKEVRAKRSTFWRSAIDPGSLLSFPASGVFGAGAGHLKRKPSAEELQELQIKGMTRSWNSWNIVFVLKNPFATSWPGLTEMMFSLFSASASALREHFLFQCALKSPGLFRLLLKAQGKTALTLALWLSIPLMKHSGSIDRQYPTIA